ncbi:MAG TPA: formylglycine-generating enzyme family protein [Candidatus Avimuribaculum pullicola]|nr:formylglycine-generating enzyme family protein [Candidatus Avimuribaculum pullicola]
MPKDAVLPYPDDISAPVRRAITAAMQSHKEDRPARVEDFLQLLHSQPKPKPSPKPKPDDDTTDIDDKPEVIVVDTEPKPVSDSETEPPRRKWMPWVVGAAVAVVAFVAVMLIPRTDPDYVLNNPQEMVYVEGGTFTMGATSGLGSSSDEKPAHSVTLDGYYIGKYEVTQKLWKAVMGSNPSDFKGDNLPVENVSWDDVQEFLRKLNAITGKNYRLPTEAEWEFAARGGNSSRGYKYSGSDNIDDVAWYIYNSGSCTHAVGTKSPNELGIYDMSGNVEEWCLDWYGSYSSSPQRNPKGPNSGSDRVYRGGSWFYYDGSCLVSNRSGYASDYCRKDIGFSLAL